jgi:hypothetical protein
MDMPTESLSRLHLPQTITALIARLTSGSSQSQPDHSRRNQCVGRHVHKRAAQINIALTASVGRMHPA